jgi:hypothetical protein
MKNAKCKMQVAKCKMQKRHFLNSTFCILHFGLCLFLSQAGFYCLVRYNEVAWN